LINAGKKIAKSLYKLLECNSKLEIITLVNLEFTDGDCMHLGNILSHNFQSLKVFKMSKIKVNEKLEYILKSLETNTNLTQLTLQRMNLNSKNISFLLSSLKNNNTLSTLDISNNSIGDGVKYFADYFNYLTNLKMNNCEINDKNIEYLMQSLENNRSIKCLELNKNKLTNNCEKVFISFFNINNVLSTIYLLKNMVYKSKISHNIKSEDLNKLILEK